MRRIFVTIALVVSSLCTSVSAKDDKCAVLATAIPLCNVLSSATQYDGKEILVRGLYRMVVHGSILTANRCPEGQVNLRGVPGSKDNKRALATIRSLTKNDQFQSVDVVLSGIFHVAHEGQCYGQNCLRYEIEATEFQCALAPK